MTVALGWALEFFIRSKEFSEENRNRLLCSKTCLSAKSGS